MILRPFAVKFSSVPPCPLETLQTTVALPWQISLVRYALHSSLHYSFRALYRTVPRTKRWLATEN